MRPSCVSACPFTPAPRGDRHDRRHPSVRRADGHHRSPAGGVRPRAKAPISGTTPRKRYLDFVQGWAVNCLGHSPPAVAEALAAQAKLLLTPSPAFYNGPSLKLAQGAGREQLLRSGVLRQFRRGSQRRRHQARAQIRREVQERRVRNHHLRRRLSRPHARDHVGVGQEGVRAAVRAESIGLPQGAAQRPRFSEGADLGQHGRRDAGADPGRSRRLAGDRSIPEGVARADQGARPAADRRRDPDRHGPHRKAVPLRTCRNRARHHDARQGHRRRRAAGRPARDRACVVLRARRPGRHLQRQSVDVRGRACGARTGRRSRNS